MKRKFLLLIKVLKTFGSLNGAKFSLAHLQKKELFFIFIKKFHRKILLRPWTGDFATIRQVLWDKEYNFNLNNVHTIVDLGANIGISTLELANKYPQAKIIALEPEKINFAMLLINTIALPNVSCLNLAIWHEDSKVTLIDSNVKSNEFEFSDLNNFSALKSVESITISSLLKRYNLENIDLLKIDVEGAEKYLFNKNDVAWLSKINCLVIEVHSADFKDNLMKMMKNDFDCSSNGEKLVFIKR